MSSPENPVAFDQQRADAYDQRVAKIAPIKDSLHLLTRLCFADLPADARILGVGVGTGAEILALAEAYPGWSFTAVEPSGPMLDRFIRLAEERGIASRCTFHQGYLDTLRADTPFDAATCFLVSHFLTDTGDRIRFFQRIASHLRPGGLLASADIVSDMASPEFRTLLPVWKKMHVLSGLTPELADTYIAALGREAAVLPPSEIAALLRAGGFEQPMLYYQNLLIHAWISQVPG